MMIEKKSFETQSVGDPSDSDKIKGQVPYENIVSKVVEKIKNEPFLFVIAIVALLIGLFVLGAKLGSPDLRFIIVVVALLAFVGILGYYILMGLKEKWRHVERLQKVTSSRTPVTEGTIDTIKPATITKYVTKVSDSEGIVIGDEAKVEQHLEGVGRPLTPDTPSAEAFTSQKQHTTLKQQLSQHQRNLTRLQAKKRVYAAGEEPLNLLNQIEAEEREIQRIQKEMEQLSRAELI